MGGVELTTSVGRVVQIDPTTDHRWDAFVASQSQASIFHHSAWLRTLEAEYGERPVALAQEDGAGELRGVLPLLSTRGLPFSRHMRTVAPRLSSLPRTPIAGPLTFDQATTDSLVRAAVELVRHKPNVHLELKVEHRLEIVVDGLQQVRWRPTFVLDLPERSSSIRFGARRHHRRIRQGVTKATRMNVRVRPAETERDLQAWYPLYLETMRTHGIPPRPYRLFAAMWSFLRPAGFMDVLFAEAGGGRGLLAGSIFLKFGQTVFYAFNGRRRAYLSLRPNDLILWNAIRAAADGGYRRFDFGEVDETNPSLARFKSKWGAISSSLYRYYYPGSRQTNELIIEEGPAAAVARVALSRLPLRATALLGDQIFRYL